MVLVKLIDFVNFVDKLSTAMRFAVSQFSPTNFLVSTFPHPKVWIKIKP
jgi:hypothetical protein